MPAKFSMRSNAAYQDRLHVLPADQRWFSFDVPIALARQGKAKRFGMSLWNYHPIEGTKKDFGSWAFRRDRETGELWYRVAGDHDGKATQNRKLLLEALRISASMSPAIQMLGILKDRRTGRCSPSHVFRIEDVKKEPGTTTLWLRLDVTSEDLGTEHLEISLPKLDSINGDQRSDAISRSKGSPLSDEECLAIRNAAVRLALQESTSQVELQSLAKIGIGASTATPLFSNFNSLLDGRKYSTPMRAFALQIFIDAIIGRFGAQKIPGIIAAAEMYFDYARSRFSGPPRDMVDIIENLKIDLTQESTLAPMVKAIAKEPPRSTALGGPSEFLREVWVRGPQHAAFRRELVRRWNGQCAVHRSACNEQLRASHVVPWSHDESIRGDVNNGLLLSVPLDNLFDRGLISFNDEGEIQVSDNLHEETKRHFGVVPGMRISWGHLDPHDLKSLKANLARHRALHFEGVSMLAR